MTPRTPRTDPTDDPTDLPDLTPRMTPRRSDPTDLTPRIGGWRRPSSAEANHRQTSCIAAADTFTPRFLFSRVSDHQKSAILEVIGNNFKSDIRIMFRLRF